MSPEQAQGGTLDTRSDVFSFGAVLYHVITGQPPFKGRTPAIVFDALLNREPEPVSRLNRAAPPDLEEIVARSLRKDRSRRYQSILDLRADLIRLEQELASGADDAAQKLPKSITARANTFLDSIAVLPFDNPLNDPETEYLSDGIAETILNNLSQLTKVRVVPRTTVFRYRRSAADPVSIGRQLGVRLVLIGRVLVQKGKLTVGAELVDAEQEAQVWGERYSRRMEEVLSVHEEIAGAIAGNLRLRIGERERQLLTRRATESREAFHLFLKGWYHANQWTPEGLRKGIDYGWRAIQEDPSYAEPYALLAYIYSVLGMLGAMRPADVLPKAKAAALSAVERREHAGSPRVALALVRLLYEWDWKGARQELERAFELEPNDPYCHLCYGVWLNAMGQSEEAIHEMKVALDADPLSTLISHNLAGVYYAAGLEDEAIEQHLRSLELNPAFPAAHGQLAVLYSRRGACEKALEEADRFLSLSGRDPRSRCFLALAYANCGMRAEAMACIENLEKEASFHGAGGFAFVYAALGERDRVFACLEKSYEDRDVFLPFLQILPEFKSLHDDPRFMDLLRRIGLPAHMSGADGEKAAR